MPDRAAVVFVHAVTAALAAAGVWFVAHFGSHVPVMDEWDLLAEWLASDSTARLVFAHHNEHRYPLTKLLWLGGLRLTGFDPKPLLYLPLGLLVAAALMLTRAARAVRGRQHPADAVIPALLLHWGHGFNWLMAYQLGFALVAWAVAGWVWCVAEWAAGGSRRWAAGSVAFAAVLVPCGGFGITFAPAVVGWCAWVAWRSRGALGAAAAAVGLAAAGYTGWVLLTLPATTGVRPDADPVGFVAATAGGLCVALGTWPARAPEAVRVAVAVAVLAVYAAAVARLWVRGKDPFRSAAAAVLTGTALTATAMAYARGTGFAERMADASAAGLAVAWVAATAGWPGRRPVPGMLAGLAAAAAVFGANVVGGAEYATAMRQSAYRVERDLRGGAPPLLLVGRHGHSLSVLVGDRMGVALARLKAAGVKPFAALPDDPPLVAHPLHGLPPVLSAGEHALPRPPAGARFLRLRVVSDRVTDRDRVLLRWPGGGEEEAWVPPRGGPLDLVFPLPARPPDPRLVVGPGVVELRVEAADYLGPPE